jgi:hypothetical protein
MILIRMAARFSAPCPTTVYKIVFYLHISAIKSNLIAGPAYNETATIAAGAQGPGI